MTSLLQYFLDPEKTNIFIFNNLHTELKQFKGQKLTFKESEKNEELDKKISNIIQYAIEIWNQWGSKVQKQFQRFCGWLERRYTQKILIGTGIFKNLWTNYNNKTSAKETIDILREARTILANCAYRVYEKNEALEAAAKKKELNQCLKSKLAGFKTAKSKAGELTNANKKSKAMIKVYTDNSYKCYSIDQLKAQLETLVYAMNNEIKLGENGTSGLLYDIYYRLKAIDQVLQAKKATKAQRKKAIEAATSLGKTLKLNIKYKF